jgi:hypothetical protein
LLKETILELSTSARGLVSHGTQRELALHVRKWEEVALIGLDDVLIETGRGLGTELITRIYVLGWGTLTRHVRGGTVQHGVGTAATAVDTTGLGIHEHLVSRLDRGDGTRILNSRKARLKLIRHLLLHENIYLTVSSSPTSHTSSTTGTPDVPITTETRERLELNTPSVGVAKAGVTLAHGTILGTVKPLSERRLVAWNFRHGVRNKLAIHSIPHIFWKRGTRTTTIHGNSVTRVALHERLHGGIITSLQPVRSIGVIGDKHVTQRVIFCGHLTRRTFEGLTIRLLHHLRPIKNENDRENRRTQHENARITTNEINETSRINYETRGGIDTIFWGLLTGWPELRNPVSSDELLRIIKPNFHLV